ncbi:hypothetical protein PG985_013156 [Apiospora marii]|uniref:Uncharacterized protein n=1 Tax=Apiospora marii TaxID=335849 RepID=A0ABR1R8Q8_9PEZI
MESNPFARTAGLSPIEEEDADTLHDNISVSSFGQTIAEQADVLEQEETAIQAENNTLQDSTQEAAPLPPPKDDPFPPPKDSPSPPPKDKNSTEAEVEQLTELMFLEKYHQLKRSKSVTSSLKVRDGYETEARHRFAYWATETWLYEFLAWMLSCYCFGGIVVTLALHHDKPIPEWPFDITINAVVSALSTIMGSALLVPLSSIIGQAKWSTVLNRRRKLADIVAYDEASRGPWGSVTLLCKKGLREPVALGAMLTILALLIAPLLQQTAVVGLQSNPVENTNATLMALDWWAEGLRTESDRPRIKDDMVMSINRGLFFDGNFSDPFSINALQPRPQCQTGNCSFGVFESLAVCSECADVSRNLTMQKSSDGSECKNGDLDETRQECARWTLNNGHDTGWLDVSSGMLMSTSASQGLISPRPELSIFNLTAIAPCWEDMYTLANTTYQYRPCNGSYGGTWTYAQECSLHWCVHKYKSEMINGILQEEVIETTHSGSYRSGMMYDFSPPNSTVAYNAVPYMARGNTSGIFGFANITTGQIYGKLSVHRQATYLVSDYLKSVLEGFTTVNSNYTKQGQSEQPYVRRLYMADRANLTNQASVGSYTEQTIARQFNMSRLFQSMALSMTSSLRTAQDQEDPWDIPSIWQSINVAPYQLVPVLRVRWGWIALPAALEVTTLLLLFYVVMWGSQRRLPVWKSSILPLLLLGSQMHNADDDNLPRHIVDMEQLAQEVSLEPETAMGRARRPNENEPEEGWDLDDTAGQETKDTNSDSELTLS